MKNLRNGGDTKKREGEVKLLQTLYKTAGIDPARMVTISFGEEVPVSMDNNEQGWALNRRAQFQIYE